MILTAYSTPAVSPVMTWEGGSGISATSRAMRLTSRCRTATPFRASSLARQLRSPGSSRQWGQLRIRDLRKFAQFFTSPGNGTCASGQIWGIPTKPGAPPTAHPPSTPSMMSSRITGAQTHRPGPRRFWPSAGPCREYRCRQILRETKSNHRSDHP